MKPFTNFLKLFVTISVLVVILLPSYSQPFLLGPISTNCENQSECYKAKDRDVNTYYANPYNPDCNMHLHLGLTKTIKAARIKIIASYANMMVDAGTIKNYYTTVLPTDEFYVIKPDGFNTLTFYDETFRPNRVYEIEVYEIAIEGVTLPFSYDNAGNMTSRTIVIAKSALIGENEEIPFSDWLDNKNILIYPNPTKGLLTFQIDGIEHDDKVSLEVYDIIGSKITEKQIYGQETTIDLSNNTAGTYILVIRINSEISRWTIIKE